MTQQITWTGDTSKVAFVFDFLGDDVDEIKFPVYLEFERANPGTLEQLQAHYWDHEKDWQANRVSLSEDQIKALSVYIQCVNDWFFQERHFMDGMNPRWRINEIINDWDQADKAGLSELRAADDWWRSSVGQIYISDVLERVDDYLGEDSYLSQKLSDFNLDEIFEIFSTLYYYRAPYDYESLWLTDDEGEVDIPEDEMDATNNFLASNTFLIDFYQASRRFRKDLAQ